MGGRRLGDAAYIRLEETVYSWFVLAMFNRRRYVEARRTTDVNARRGGQPILAESSQLPRALRTIAGIPKAGAMGVRRSSV